MDGLLNRIFLHAHGECLNLVAHDSLVHYASPKAKQDACVSILTHWHGPSTHVVSNEQVISMQDGRVSITWDALKRARPVYHLARKLLAPGQRAVLCVRAPADFAACQAALLCAVGPEFALSYAYSCVRHVQVDCGMAESARALFRHVYNTVAPPPDISALTEDRPRTEHFFLRHFQKCIVDLDRSSRAQFMTLFRSGHLVVQRNSHAAFLRLWKGLENTLCVSTRALPNGLTLKHLQKCKSDTCFLYIEDAGAPFLAREGYMYTKKQFQLLLAFVLFHPAWAERIVGSPSKWVPSPVDKLMTLLGLPRRAAGAGTARDA